MIRRMFSSGLPYMLAGLLLTFMGGYVCGKAAGEKAAARAHAAPAAVQASSVPHKLRCAGTRACFDP